jgi:hypothetical protein
MTVSTPTTAGQILTSAYVNNNINSGLVYITEASTAATSLSFDNCFTSTYLTYRIVGNITSSAISNKVGLRFRVGGSDASTSNYTWVGWNLSSSAGTPSSTLNGGQAASIAFFAYKSSTSTHNTGFVIDIYNPKSATNFKGGNFLSSNQTGSLDTLQGGFSYGVTTAYDGFSIISESGNMTCTAKVYGYRQA